MKDEKNQEIAVTLFSILKDVYDIAPWSKEQILADINRPEADYFFAYDDKEIVGFLSIQHLVGEIELTNLAVKKAYQGQGLGSQLLEMLTRDELPIFLEVRASNQTAQALYQKFGFQIVAKRKDYYHNPKEDAILMKREGLLGY
ncbi:ribosomal-protein-alanine acetyltransferase [Streptococcus ratti FA-1 = DSM 20564]|uniref:[Ribosomal protein bS18]-alanine N-acetyltransferase n=3 Tax=Streptococcus ratti TaxID=1341 RepID=A0A7X9LCW8_STRRT|nr:ribosomal protein S18-alanine N-acetyltransferase [Streptococcus ratti]EJN94441.1 putative ribosomal-protein-alanine acetyltransferase [Streptococcus ratti FA-1 = DSM 20564]EMP70414.1 ribosomal-protein-alanine acetyltransferase [Streptococcus ratti FA-1 = DSM 20564]NMD48811.1 ribosomal protein S18-alanine N-acetyltransferase [Streptococcus ratti]